MAGSRSRPEHQQPRSSVHWSNMGHAGAPAPPTLASDDSSKLIEVHAQKLSCPSFTRVQIRDELSAAEIRHQMSGDCGLALARLSENDLDASSSFPGSTPCGPRGLCSRRALSSLPTRCFCQANSGLRSAGCLFRRALLYSLVGWFFTTSRLRSVGGDTFRGVQMSRAGVLAGAAARLISSIRFLPLRRSSP